MHTELLTGEQGITGQLKNEAGQQQYNEEPATYNGAKVIYLAAHRSKQMIKEAAALKDQSAQIKNLPYGSISFRWLRVLKNWCSNFFRS
jgi:hypothetical protein